MDWVFEEVKMHIGRKTEIVNLKCRLLNSVQYYVIKKYLYI